MTNIAEIARQMVASSNWSDFDDRETIADLTDAGVPHVRSVIRGTASEAQEVACLAALRALSDA